MGDKQSEAIALTGIGAAYCRVKNYHAALDCLQRSLAIIRTSNNDDAVANALNDIGNVCTALNDMPAALTHYQESLAIAERISNRRRQAEALLGIGAVHVREARADEAVARLEQAFKLAEQLGTKDLQYKAHYHLSHAFEHAGALEQALAHLRLYQDVREQVLNEQSDKTLKKLQAVHEVETARHEAEIFRLRNIQLAELNAHLKELVSEKNELLSIAAHDLKNPLCSILMTTSIVQDLSRTMARQEVVDRMAQIDSVVQRMVGIISNLLKSDEIESGQLKLQLETLDLGRLAEEIAAEYGERAQSKRIAIACAGEAAGALALLDANAARQILDNLVSNALKYSLPGSRVQVRIRIGAGTVRCEVADEGPGLTPEDMKHVFKKFRRLSAKPTGGEHSTGIGLSIVKQLVERMQGRVWCESAPGSGATFIVEFPCARPSAAVSLPSPAAVPHPDNAVAAARTP